MAANPALRDRRDVEDATGPVANPITDPTTRAVAEVANTSYDVLVTALFGSFAGSRHDPAAPVVKTVFLELMTTVIRPLGALLTHMPMGPEYGDLCAGPNFETSRSVELLPHAHAARIAAMLVEA